jgi:hypothetical protein
MQEKLSNLNYEFKKTGFHINLAKTEEMRINNKSNNTIILGNQTNGKWLTSPTSVAIFLT